MSIDLPPGFTSTESYAAQLHECLSSEFVQALLNAHPNEVAIHGPPHELGVWWNWALSLPMSDVLDLALGKPSCTLLESTSRLLDDIQRLRLPRGSRPMSHTSGPLPKGQTPKKAHEVEHFVLCVSSLCEETGVRRVVDVGAGQGYLSMALASTPHNLQVLALDSSPVQTSGSIHWASGAKQDNLTLTHATHHISAETLPGLVSNWLDETAAEGADEHDRDAVVVGLHACGSLTPETLRACISNILFSPYQWRVRACAVIGCCYNLLSPEDTHLSSLPSLLLPLSALHLAAQPWLPPTRVAVDLTLRKIAYRALLARTLHTHEITLSPEQRVGRLKDSVYESWSTYLSAASARLELGSHLKQDELDAESERLGVALAALHVLRAALGPVIESWILLDRYVWLCESFEGTEAKVGLKWVFDVDMSARGAVLIVKT